MKRRWSAALAAGAVLALLAVCALLLRPQNAAPAQEEITFSGERDVLRAEFVYDEGLRALSGTQRMTLTNRTGEDLEEIVLRLYMNAQAGGSAAVSGVSVDGAKAKYAQDEEDASVLRIAAHWPAGCTVDLSFTLMIRHGKTDGAAIVTLPQLAMREDGDWRTDAFDGLAARSYAQAFDYVVRVNGEIAAQMEHARDASLAILPGGKTRTAQAGGVRLTALAASRAEAQRLLAAGKEALSQLEALGFPCPFAALTLAAAGTERADGIALSGLIAVRADADQKALLRRVTRLAAQQTFGIDVESDPWNAPWLSESIASALEMLACRRKEGQAVYEARLFEEMEIAARVTRPYGVTVGAGTAHFGGDAEMTQVLRDQGGAMLLGIEQAVGEETFLQALRLYAQRCGEGIASQADFEAALAEASGSSWSGYLRDELTY